MREGPGRIRWLTEAEEVALLGTLRQTGKYEAHQLTVFLLDTGLRLGEALRLGPGDLAGDKVHVWETKADKPRTVPLTKRAMLAAWGAISKDSYQHTLARAMTLAGIEGASAHTLRHTFASRLVQRGVGIPEVQALLGHKSIQTTMRYAHLSSDNLRDAVGVLEDRVAPTLRRVK